MVGSVLFIDRDWVTVSELLPAFAAQGYRLDYAPPGLQAMRRAMADPPDMVILGMNPEDNDWEFLQQFRGVVDTPLLLLLSTTSKMDRVKALELGADDCMAKPILAAEALARVHALLRRSEPQPARPEHYCFRDQELVIDLARAEVLMDGKPVDLTPIEFRLLSYFAQHPDELLSHDRLARQVWGGDYPGSRAAIKQYVHQLRLKIEPAPSHPTRILTRWGHGYIFKPIEQNRN